MAINVKHICNSFLFLVEVMKVYYIYNRTVTNPLNQTPPIFEACMTILRQRMTGGKIACCVGGWGGGGGVLKI
jgi:hypothetical protein